MGIVPFGVSLEYTLSAKSSTGRNFRPKIVDKLRKSYVQTVADRAKTGLYLDIAPRNSRKSVKFWNFKNVNDVRGSDAGVEWIKKRQNKLTTIC